MAKDTQSSVLNPQEELKRIRAEKKKLTKRENELKGQKNALKDIEKFRALLKVRAEVDEIHSKAMAQAKAVAGANGVSLSTLDKLKTKAYLYQHPLNKKLKSNNKNEGWVMEACGLGSYSGTKSGGVTLTLQDLENTALLSQLQSFNRARSRKVKKSGGRSSDTTNEKTNVIGNRGIR
jgi:hypothetical protein